MSSEVGGIVDGAIVHRYCFANKRRGVIERRQGKRERYRVSRLWSVQILTDMTWGRCKFRPS